MLSVRQLQKTKLFPNEAVGINGVIIQGSAGIGKSAMIEAIFKSRDIEELPKDGSPINPQKQYYIKVEAALPLTQKKELIINAFENGHVLWIDELNSCMNDGLEKILNSALTGSHPNNGAKAKIPGFAMISSVNGNELEGRSQLSPAILHRAHLVKAKELREYSQEDLSTILQHWNLQQQNFEKAAKDLKELLNSSEGSKLSLRSLRDSLARPSAITEPEVIDQLFEGAAAANPSH